MGILEVPIVYLIAGLLILDGAISAIQRREPLWMTRQMLRAYIRFGKQSLYLRQLLTASGDRLSGGVSLPVSHALKAAGHHEEAQPAVALIQNAVTEGRSVVLYGEQGAGKTIALEAAVLLLAQQALRARLFAAAAFIAVGIMLLFTVPWLALLWVISYVFWETLLFRVPLPLVLRAAELPHEPALLSWYEQQAHQRLGGRPAFHDDAWVTLFVDDISHLQPHHAYAFFQDLQAYLTLNPQANVVAAVRPHVDIAEIELHAALYEMQPLDDDGLRLFTDWWVQKHDGDSRELLREQAQQALRQLEEKGLTTDDAHGRNQFWLGVMIATGQYSHNRARLLHDYCEHRLARAIPSDTSQLEAYRQTLTKLALWMHPIGPAGAANPDQVRQAKEMLQNWLEGTSIAPDTFLNDMARAEILKDPFAGRIQFTNHIIQEYFTAYGLYLKNDWELARRKAEDLEWWPVIFLLGGILEARGQTQRISELAEQLMLDEAGIRHYLAVVGLMNSLEHAPLNVDERLIEALTNQTGAGLGLAEQQAIERLVHLTGEAVIRIFEQMHRSPDPQKQLIATVLMCAAGVPQCDDLLLNKPVQETLPVFQALGAPAVEYLLSRLESSDDVICYRASELLIAMGAPVLDLMGSSLAHSQARVRRYVTRIITRIGGAGAFQLLYQALDDEDYDVWYQAADGLRSLSEDQMAVLARRAQDPGISERMKKRIEVVLSSRAPGRADVERLDVAQDYEMDTSKIEGPSRSMGDPSAFQVLLKPGFRFGSPRRQEGRAFRGRGYQLQPVGTGKQASWLMESGAQGENMRFEKFDFPPDFEHLLERLGHPSVYVRSAAIDEVRKFGTMLVPYLLKALETENRTQVEGVLDALAEVANTNSLKHLRAFRDKIADPALRKRADRVIQRSRLRTL